MPTNIEQYSNQEIVAHIVESETLAEGFSKDINESSNNIEDLLSLRRELDETEMKKIQALRDNLEKIKSNIHELLNTTQKMISSVGVHAAFFQNLKIVEKMYVGFEASIEARLRPKSRITYGK